jgi:cytochrome P450
LIGRADRLTVRRMVERAGATAPAGAPAQGCPFHGDVAADFRPFDTSDPFAFYERARREQPVFFSEELGFWVVTRHDDIRAIFKDPATFSSEITQAPYKERPPEVQKVLDDGEFTAYSGLSARQPPDHTRLRGFIKKAFTPRRIAVLEPQIRRLVREMLDEFDGDPVDLVAGLTYELPARVIFRLLGVPDEDVADVKRWAASRVVLSFGDQPLDEQLHHAENLVSYWRYCLDLVNDRFAHPRDDLPSDLVRIYKDGDQSIDVHEMASLMYSQLTAGHETTSSLLAGGLKELLGQRARWEELCADLSLAPAAVEEMLRISTPVFAWKRLVKRPARVADVDLEPGDRLLLILGSANHDETVFEEPEVIDLHRPNGRNHLAFGLGIHFCLGAPLARLEGQVVLEELATRFPDMRLVPDQAWEYPPNTTFRAPRQVWVHLGEERPPLVRDLADCCGEDVAAVGGKAAGLGTLMQAGFPVPDGFAVTTHAFEAALGGGVSDRIAAELCELDCEDVEAVEDCGLRLRALVETTPLPTALTTAIRAAYRGLGDDVPVAVRSSATAEDGAEASFAGQQDTYLWVVGEDAVVDHVRRCWASLYSARSIAYRAERGIAHDGIQMGVAVQRMVPARAAGVAMTLNPANGDRSKIAIEASYGLGESVVSGAVTPDSLLVDKVMLEVVDARVACKEIELVPDVPAGCVTEREVEEERRSLPALSPAEAKQVAALAKRAEQHYGAPQDVEWAVADDATVVMLQSRPETVWSRAPQQKLAPSTGFATGMTSLVNTLMNPLAARRAEDVDADR